MQFQLPELGEGVYEAEMTAWLVKPGDAVRHGQNLLEVMTDKATMEVPAPFDGTVTELHARPGQKVKIGEAILTYTPAGEDGTREPAAPAAKPTEKPQPPTANGGPPRPRDPVSAGVRAAPSVRLLARQMGIDLAAVHGTGPDGRILHGDLSTLVQRTTSEPRKLAEPRPDYGTPGTRVKLAGVRRKVAEHMVLAKRTIPHYTYVDECDVSALVRLREELKDAYAQAGVKLTYLAFFVKAAAAALKDVPVVNASLDEAAEEIVLHDRYHVGVAVATPSGLVVPVVKDADKKDLTQIARDIDALSAAARSGKLRREDLRGGTFTVTSVGNVGGLISTPIINHPEVAILGLGKVVRRPVFDSAGNVKPADLIYLSLSFDHRVVDGAVGAVFANAIIQRLQKPATLLLPEKL
jgi:2-oxoisovalerate dehydrogenase E2 component (dihydrolipoyl transacylase)